MTDRIPLLKAAEVAEWLHVSLGWISDHASGRRKPVLPSKKMGKVRRFLETDVEKWLLNLNGGRVS